MFFKIPYTSFNNRYRPYLEVIFFNDALIKSSSRTFGLVDSGADLTVIPYSLGRAIGLEAPNETEYENAGGIGGNISLIKRSCKIYLFSGDRKNLYAFDEEVSWAYPTQEIQKQVTSLGEEYTKFEKMLEDVRDGSDLQKSILELKNSKQQDIIELMNKFETDVLLGRPFFNNFYFIQFLHKDRVHEEKCFLNYKIKESKIVKTVPI